MSHRRPTALGVLLPRHGGTAQHLAVASKAGVAVDGGANHFGSIDALPDHVALRGFVEIVAVLLDLDGDPLPQVMPLKCWARPGSATAGGCWLNLASID